MRREEKVETTKTSGDKRAGSGCMARLVLHLLVMAILPAAYPEDPLASRGVGALPLPHRRPAGVLLL